ncbi:MAG: sugar ABC transporter permease [Acidimicrobiia bacterium]|nr:sugar ABC transporter permease [Acidimicrobiia bacterium]MDH4308524.1 sugar ABC transporter permease [Acidimicrobiia bacterium]MDH5294650.1 sugar ABC transporter permease [Acidimicrobiia bacterium]
MATWLTAPTWVILMALFAVPLAVGVYLSFRSENLSSLGGGEFIGFENYTREVLSRDFVAALRTTVLVMVIGMVVQLPLALVLAVFLRWNLRGTRFYRSVLLLPMLLTPVAVGLMWRFMLNTDLGIINWLLTETGFGAVRWLGDPASAIAAVVLVDSWQAVPFLMLLLLAGLAGLSGEPEAAAAVDGANGFQVFRYVTLPMLKPVLLVALMLRLIDGIKLFDTIFIVTGGGPGTATQTLSLLDYRVGFTFLATSRGAAIGVVLALMTLPVYFIWRRVIGVEAR